MPPYRSARPSADGSCFTNGYRKIGQILTNSEEVGRI